MSKPRTRADKAVDEFVRTLEQARSRMVHRLNDLDFKAMRKRGARLAGSLQSELQQRVRPRRRRGFPGGGTGIAGLVAAALAGAAVAYLLTSEQRRRAAQERLAGVGRQARQRYAELTGGRTPAEADLEARVQEAIAAQGTPEGMEVAVEGRTVYLRGTVPDPAVVDQAAERIHAVDGVVAVVNLTTSANSGRS
jgi:hypothetical protein